MSTTEKAFKFNFFQLPITVQSQKHLLKLLKSTDKNNSYQFIGLDVRVARSILIRSLQRSPTPVTSSHRHRNLQDLLFLHHLLLLLGLSFLFGHGLKGQLVFKEFLASGRGGSPGSVGSGYGLWGMCLLRLRLCRVREWVLCKFLEIWRQRFWNGEEERVVRRMPWMMTVNGERFNGWKGLRLYKACGVRCGRWQTLQFKASQISHEFSVY